MRHATSFCTCLISTILGMGIVICPFGPCTPIHQVTIDLVMLSLYRAVLQPTCALMDVQARHIPRKEGRVGYAAEACPGPWHAP